MKYLKYFILSLFVVMVVVINYQCSNDNPVTNVKKDPGLQGDEPWKHNQVDGVMPKIFIFVKDSVRIVSDKGDTMYTMYPLVSLSCGDCFNSTIDTGGFAFQSSWYVSGLGTIYSLSTTVQVGYGALWQCKVGIAGGGGFYTYYGTWHNGAGLSDVFNCYCEGGACTTDSSKYSGSFENIVYNNLSSPGYGHWIHLEYGSTWIDIGGDGKKVKK